MYRINTDAQVSLLIFVVLLYQVKQCIKLSLIFLEIVFVNIFILVIRTITLKVRFNEILTLVMKIPF